MPLDSFPPEIISIIGSHIASINDLFNFLRSNRNFYNLLIHSLYRRNAKADGGSALVWYASQGNETGIRSMLAAGGNINIREPKQAQSTAVMEAIHHNNTGIVKILLENGALPDAANLHSRRPLTLSTSARSEVAITKLLLEYGANINFVAFDKRAPLMEAIRSNQEVKVGMLLDHGVDIDITHSRDAMSPLHVAAARNAKPAIIKMLVDAGIYVDAPDGQGWSPLQVAALHPSMRAVRRLLDHGANVNFENMSPSWKGWTALFYAANSRNSRNDNKTIIKTLVLHGAKIDSTNFAQETPLLYAVSRGATKQAQIFLEHGASITAKNANQETILHLAVSSWSWSPDMIRWLVERGADVNRAGGKHGETPIFYARRCGLGLERIRNLVSLGADVNFQNINGLTPLSLASRMCSTEFVKLLLDSGALSIQGKCKGTLLCTILLKQTSALHQKFEKSFHFSFNAVRM